MRLAALRRVPVSLRSTGGVQCSLVQLLRPAMLDISSMILRASSLGSSLAVPRCINTLQFIHLQIMYEMRITGEAPPPANWPMLKATVGKSGSSFVG